MANANLQQTSSAVLSHDQLRVFKPLQVNRRSIFSNASVAWPLVQEHSASLLPRLESLVYWQYSFFDVNDEKYDGASEKTLFQTKS